MPLRHARHVLAAEPLAARTARGLLRTVLEGWGLSSWHDDVSLALSELVTNGAIHAKTLLVIDISSDDHWLEVSVTDDSPWPVQRRPHRHDVAADLSAVMHAEQHLGVQLDERDVRLDVGAAGTLAGGRGLLLVEGLADAWGVTPRAVGKAVWARFSLQAGP